MTFLSLHLADWIVIVAYFGGMIWIGRATSSSVHGQSDFFLAGRKLGGILQFFLNFGNMTDASGAAKTSSLVYSQGAGGVWLGMQLLFITPYYWFMNAWFRRVRLTTVADLFLDRFGSRKLAMLYAVFNIFFNIIFIGGSYLVAYKIVEVLVVKPESAYTLSEAQMVDNFYEYRELGELYAMDSLSPGQAERYEYLHRLDERGELKSYVPYVKPLPVYLVFAVVVGVYIILGGMAAAAVTDAVQGLLIVVFSLMLIPFGLWEIGGLRAFHDRLPDRMLDLLGSGAASEFAWYSIAAIILITLVQIHAAVGNMAVAGSARNERAASLGAVTGGFAKRWMTIAWCFCGLIAFALYGQGLSDPDAVWGMLCRTLLGPGLLGLMLVGILAADMSTMSAQCLTLSALFVKNIFPTLCPGRSEKEGLLIGRILIALALILGIGVAVFIRDILSFMKLSLTLNVAFGASVWVIFKWRRITATAVLICVVVSLAVILIIPYSVPTISSLSENPGLLAMTHERSETRYRDASPEEVAAGLAVPHEEVAYSMRIAPRPVYFDRIISVDPADPDSKMRGAGRFHLELFLLSKCGVDTRSLSASEALALTYLFDVALPFILLFGVSLLTRDRDPQRTQDFYIKMRTPALADPEADAASLAENRAYPERTESCKLFPGSSWELMRWKRQDAVAFVLCSAFAGFVLGSFFLLLQVGR